MAFEYSFDTFNVNKDHLFRVNMITKQNGVEQENDAFTHYGLGPAVADQVPEVAGYARVHPNGSSGTFVFENGDGQRQAINAEGIYFTDPSFLTLFSYPLIQGDPSTVLKAPHSMLLSESTARKFFGSTDPLGKELEVVA